MSTASEVAAWLALLVSALGLAVLAIAAWYTRHQSKTAAEDLRLREEQIKQRPVLALEKLFAEFEDNLALVAGGALKGDLLDAAWTQGRAEIRCFLRTKGEAKLLEELETVCLLIGQQGHPRMISEDNAALPGKVATAIENVLPDFRAAITRLEKEAQACGEPGS